MSNLQLALWAALWFCRRVLAVAHTAVSVTRRHAPRWISVAIGLLLIIPGPVDDLAIIGLVGWVLWRRPQLRLELPREVRAAWDCTFRNTREIPGGIV